MKKILIVIDTNVGGKGGAETHLWNFLRLVDQSLVAIDVIYFDSDEADTNKVRSQTQGINYHRVPIGKIHSLSSLKHLKKIYTIMKSGHYDCVISFFESSDIITAFLATFAGIKMRISNRRDTGFLNSRKVELVYRVINKFFTHFIAVSNAVKQSIVEQGVRSDRIHIIHNAVEINRFNSQRKTGLRQELGLSPDDLVYGMVANLNPVKNHCTVIAALKELHSVGQLAHLIFAGEGMKRQELEKQVAELELSSYVHFLGSREDIENVLAAYDIFILASFTEGLSNALLEAMAAGKPVIASSVGGNLEVVQDGVDGFLVEPEVGAVTIAMKALYENQALRLEMGDKAFYKVKTHFSLDQMLAQYMSLFELADNVSALSKHSISSS